MTIVPLKRLAAIRVSNVDKKSVDGEVSIRLCNYTDVYYRDEIEPDQDFMTATASPDQVEAFRLQPDDVIITKDSETAEDIGVPTYVRAAAPDLVCGYHLAMLRPDRSKLDGRFLYWFMSSTRAKEQLAVAATGVTRFGLREDATGGVLIQSWDLSRQRAIADYLDTETVRIDALIDGKRRQSRLLQLREATVLSRHVQALTDRHGAVPLRRLLNGVEQGSSPVCDNAPAEADEWGVLKTSSVSSGRFLPEENKRLPGSLNPDLRWLVRVVCRAVSGQLFWWFLRCRLLIQVLDPDLAWGSVIES